MLFLANAIGYRIRQYYEHEMLPKDDVLPLFDAENTEDCIILLWVKTDGSGMLNHIVPVLPKGICCFFFLYPSSFYVSFSGCPYVYSL